MPKWYCELDGKEFSTEEEAFEAALEYVDTCDMENCIEYGITMDDIFEELARLNSPLYEKLVELAHQRIFEDFFCEIDDDDDEENEE
jgi:hypothetical protein